MSRTSWTMVAAMLAAGCAHKPVEPPPSPEPAPAVVTEEPAPPQPVEAAPAAEAPAPEPAARPEQGDGPYRVAVSSERTAEETTPMVKRLESEGLHVAVESAEVEGTTWQRVVLPGYRNGREARAMVAYLDAHLSLKSWVVPKNAPASPPAPSAAPSAPAPAAPESAKPAAAEPEKPAAGATPSAEPGSKPDEHPEN